MSTLTNTVAPENGASVTDTTFYPVPVFHFKVNIGDHEGVFTEVSGLNSSVDVIEYRHGMSKGQVYKMPGISNTDDVSLINKLKTQKANPLPNIPKIFIQIKFK